MCQIPEKSPNLFSRVPHRDSNRNIFYKKREALSYSHFINEPGLFLSKDWLKNSKTGLLIWLLFFVTSIASAQKKEFDKRKFFKDDRLIEMTLVTDFKKLIKEKLNDNYRQNFLPATITCIFPDSTKITEKVEIRSRGKYRREEFYLPPIMVNFKTPDAVSLKKLGRLKLVWPSDDKSYDEQLVLKEYLVYKIYNLLTEKSFRVRLVRMTSRVINEKIRPRSSYAFFIEAIDDLASRNSCVEVQSVRFHTERTNRDLTTMVRCIECSKR